MQHLQTKPTRSRGKQTIFVHNELHKCTHMFVRRDSVRRPLQVPYDGPCPVIKRSDKFYKVSIHGKPTSETKPNLRKTRSGRRDLFPIRNE
ncbi:hypothetical protein TNCV_2349321 [Trichonephila clavipes]|uniref:Uncharacterized protein n=1 Tax=Trichonephila clavipes TaxID=2585209 RepID=A0A8X6SVT7_TRICX|nr:hypothetical protein TNCV_2349321 [Trichonephila clavipes]